MGRLYHKNILCEISEVKCFKLVFIFRFTPPRPDYH